MWVSPQGSRHGLHFVSRNPCLSHRRLDGIVRGIAIVCIKCWPDTRKWNRNYGRMGEGKSDRIIVPCTVTRFARWWIKMQNKMHSIPYWLVLYVSLRSWYAFMGKFVVGEINLIGFPIVEFWLFCNIVQFHYVNANLL